MKPIITSEYKQLKAVMVHTPGEEHRQVIPWEGDHPFMGPYPRVHHELRRDHQDLKQFLIRETGAGQVFEVADLLREIFEQADYQTRYRILQDTLHTRADMYVDHLQARSIRLEKYPAAELVRDLIEGYPRSLAPNNGRLPNIIISPKREMMWVRDSSATTQCGVVITSMASSRRRHEPTLVRSIFKHHPMFEPGSIFLDMVELLRNIDTDPTQSGLQEHLLLEGGNILVLSEDTLAIGVGRHEYLYSNRTTRAAFELLVEKLLEADLEHKIRRIYLVNVPDLRGFIHLDTVFNMVGPKAAIAMPYIFGYPDPETDGGPKAVLQHFISWVRSTMEVKQTDLSRVPSQEHFEHAGKVEIYDRDYIRQRGRVERLPVPSRYFLDQLIEDGLIDPARITWIGGSPDDYPSPYEHLMTALFEQHNMAGNVFTTAPFRAVAYHRNPLTAHALKACMQRCDPAAHLELMSSNEIRTDNGGPHCLTMPLLREL
ncbi:MAG: arginine deiminase family protein [Bacteroidia bacterium]|nr:arginine deiminase family protein [Bacteroidia bacterium]